MPDVTDLLYSVMAANYGSSRRAAPAPEQTRLVPVTELTPEEIKKYAPPGFDPNASGAAFAKFRVPYALPPSARKHRAAGATGPSNKTPPPDEIDKLAGMIKFAGQSIAPDPNNKVHDLVK
jgi:hypothetical protein